MYNAISLDYSSKYYQRIFRNILLYRLKRERRLKPPNNDENKFNQKKRQQNGHKLFWNFELQHFENIEKILIELEGSRKERS